MYVFKWVSNVSAKSWQEQVIFWWEDEDICFVLDQHLSWISNSASTLKQQSTDRHVPPLRHTKTSLQIDMSLHSDTLKQQSTDRHVPPLRHTKTTVHR